MKQKKYVDVKVRLDRGLYDRLMAIAKREDRALPWLIRSYLPGGVYARSHGLVVHGVESVDISEE